MVKDSIVRVYKIRKEDKIKKVRKILHPIYEQINEPNVENIVKLYHINA